MSITWKQVGGGQFTTHGLNHCNNTWAHYKNLYINFTFPNFHSQFSNLMSFTNVVKEGACVKRGKNKDVSFFKNKIKYLYLSCLMYRPCLYATKFLLDKGTIKTLFCKLKGLLDRNKNSSNDGSQMTNMELQNMPLTHQLMPLIITRLL